MLRALVLILLLGNLGFYAWRQGWMDAYISVRANADREPERLARQVHPEIVRILPPGAASAPPPAAPTACLEAGPYNDAELAAAKTYLQGLVPAGSWVSVDATLPGTWIVYMGKFANRDAMTKKEDELKRRKLSYEELPARDELAPGLSLGRYDNSSAADQALDSLSKLGVRTARVAQIAPASTQHRLRIERADESLASRLASVQASELGSGFSPCSSTSSR